jgi:hypothetical protein
MENRKQDSLSYNFDACVRLPPFSLVQPIYNSVRLADLLEVMLYGSLWNIFYTPISFSSETYVWDPCCRSPPGLAHTSVPFRVVAEWSRVENKNEVANHEQSATVQFLYLSPLAVDTVTPSRGSLKVSVDTARSAHPTSVVYMSKC